MIATSKAEVIERLPFVEYVKIPAVNASGLVHALDSAMQYQAKQRAPREDNDTLRAGRADHTGALEPERLLREYAQWETERVDPETGEIKKRIRRGKEWEAFQLANAGKTILTPAQFATAMRLRDAVRDDDVAGPLVKGVGKNELTIVWTHQRTGLRVKCRIDRLIHGRALIDLKFTVNPLPAAFEPVARRLHYYMRMSLYSTAVEIAGLGTPAVKIIAAQSEEPHEVVVYDLEHEELAFGRDEYERAIDVVAKCRAEQRWPGFANGKSIPLKLPGWLLAQNEASHAVSFDSAEVIQ